MGRVSARERRESLIRAAKKATDGMEGGEQVRPVVTNAYTQLISTYPETLLMQIQGYAIVAAAEAQGDDPIGELVRAGWMRIWEAVHLSLGRRW